MRHPANGDSERWSAEHCHGSNLILVRANRGWKIGGNDPNQVEKSGILPPSRPFTREGSQVQSLSRPPLISPGNKGVPGRALSPWRREKAFKTQNSKHKSVENPWASFL